ncbi:hypothetical protein B1C81_19110 [Streptomyces sp. HG99]|nr:hypothetical protein B1C81_19110 [Streptomyces sp. HG99]
MGPRRRRRALPEGRVPARGSGRCAGGSRAEGDGRIARLASRGALGPAGLADFDPGTGAVELEPGEQGGQFLFGAGKPLRTPAYMCGGFCLSSRTRVAEAVERYRSGAMHGLLTAP